MLNKISEYLSFGHSFSNPTSLEDYYSNLFIKLKDLYVHVYLSGDYLPVTELMPCFTKIVPPEYIPLSEL